MGIASRLRELRDQRRLSVKDVAQSLGVAESTYRDWEYGRQIKGEPYAKLAQFYNVSLKWLLTGEREGLERDLEELEILVRRIKAKL